MYIFGNLMRMHKYYWNFNIRGVIIIDCKGMQKNYNAILQKAKNALMQKV